MDMTAQALFDGHPDPMWVFEKATLRIVDVNAAAVRRFGYSRDQLQSMLISDLRPVEGRPRLIEALSAVGSDPVEAGI